MTKHIVINDCNQCPYIFHSGHRPDVELIPMCARDPMNKIEIPYVKKQGMLGVTAEKTVAIPGFCPLDDMTV